MGYMQGQNNQKKRKAVKDDVPELNGQALHNLVGFFDVLIQMDIAQKVSNEIRSKEDDSDLQSISEDPTKTD